MANSSSGNGKGVSNQFPKGLPVLKKKKKVFLKSRGCDSMVK